MRKKITTDENSKGYDYRHTTRVKEEVKVKRVYKIMTRRYKYTMRSVVSATHNDTGRIVRRII